MSTRYQTSRLIHEYLRKNANTVVHLRDIEKELGVGANRLTASLSYLIAKSDMGIRHGPMRGTYVYNSAYQIAPSKPVTAPTKAVPNVYEYVGTIDDNSFMIRGENDMLYVATAMKNYFGERH